MADLPQLQNPDILRSMALGQQIGMQNVMAPYQVQGAQQDLEKGQLSIDQLRQAMQMNQVKMGLVGQALQSSGEQGDTQQNSDFGYSVNNMSQGTRRALGLLAPEMLKGMDEGDASALMTAQLRSQQPGSPLIVMQKLSADPNAGKALLQPANAKLLMNWPQVAQRYGLDQQDLSDINVRIAATLEANSIRARLKMTPLPMPVGYKNLYGANGQLVQQQIGGETPGKETEVTGQKLPTFALEKSWNPALGRNQGMMLQTSPGGAPAPGAPGGRSAGTSSVPGAAGLGKQASAPIDLGYDKPTPENYKGAQFADYFKTGVDEVNKIEATGYSPSPKARAIMIDAATSEKDGLTHQYLMQMALKKGLNAQDKTYMSAAFPMLQAIGHDLAGMRLPTNALRSQFESAIPTDVADSENMAQVQRNRASFYRSLSTQAGPLVNSPAYQNTIGKGTKHPDAIQALLDKYPKKQ